jgi:hypothetical protein
LIFGFIAERSAARISGGTEILAKQDRKGEKGGRKQNQ